MDRHGAGSKTNPEVATPVGFKKKAAPLGLSERIVEASLNGSAALSVFESAASDLDLAAQELSDVATEALTEADNIVKRAALEAKGLEDLAILASEEAEGHIVKAQNIRALVGAKGGAQ